MTETFFAQRRPHQGFTYDAYLEIMAERASASTVGLDEEAAERVGYTKLNLHRSQRIARTYTVPDDLVALLDRLAAPQLWMVLTEPWCGDSAQCLPYIAAVARCNPAVDLRLLPRDDNLDIMDLYLTDGKRSIPRLIVFDGDGNELAGWGPRPTAAGPSRRSLPRCCATCLTDQSCLPNLSHMKPRADSPSTRTYPRLQRAMRPTPHALAQYRWNVTATSPPGDVETAIHIPEVQSCCTTRASCSFSRAAC